MRSALFLAIALVLMSLLGCGKSTIAGKYVTTKPGGKMTINLAKDSTFTTTFGKRPDVGKGTYEISGDKITLRLEQYAGEKATKEDYDHPLVFKIEKDGAILRGAGEMILQRQ